MPWIECTSCYGAFREPDITLIVWDAFGDHFEQWWCNDCDEQFMAIGMPEKPSPGE